ncbi:hypothetical protein [Bacillus sp. 445_BSPC]|uniref:hypothetical protein n=1 Tax=Bacillus sp. 445_BSPC TaxID=1581712 RepID=UPI0006629D08|nr:hypothetical protein [Bacillus sp. 445_BSPC]
MNNVFTRGWINLSIQWGLDGFSNYIDEMEEILSVQLKKLEKEYKEETKNISEDQAEDLFDYNYADKVSYLKDEFPNILRKSFVTSLYSFLEQQLGKICEQVQLARQDDSKIRTGIFYSHKYLTKEVRVDFDTLNEAWSKIEKINKIRNHIVHNGEDTLNKVTDPKSKKDEKNNETLDAFIYYNLAKEDKDYNDFLKSENKVHKLKYDIKISSDFCEEILSDTREFFDTLTNLLKDHQA